MYGERLLFTVCITAVLFFVSVFYDSNFEKITANADRIGKNQPHHRRRGQRLSKATGFECTNQINGLYTNVRALIIDIDFLKQTTLECAEPYFGKIKIAVEERDRGQVDNKTFSEYDVIFYRDDATRDYIEIVDYDGKRRILPRFLTQSEGKFEYPTDLPAFLKYWESSRMIECLGLDIPRAPQDAKRRLKLEGIVDMALYRDFLLALGIHPFLNGGSLLGWYRECSIIPHTQDVDFAARATEYNSKLLEKLQNSADFRLKRILGVKEDSYEITIHTKAYNWPIDLFFVYDEGNTSWVGGTGADLSKYIYTYPRITSLCTALLLEHYFWVPCNVLEILQTEHGSNWRIDYPTRRFNWNSSHRN
ncbi:unnamed protein product, partial [Mesorhabditis spiculigera]